MFVEGEKEGIYIGTQKKNKCDLQMHTEILKG